MKPLYLIVFLTFLVAYSNGQVSGNVFRDFNANGKLESSGSYNEPGVSGIIISAYNSANVIIASYLSPASGAYAIPASGVAYNNIKGSNTGFVPAGTAVRIEFSGLKTGDYSAPVGPDNKGNVQFTIAPATNITFAVIYPEEYSKTAPRLATSVYQEGNAPGTEQVLVTVDYNASGSSKTYPNISTEASQSQIGATYGLAYHRLSNTLFASAYQKRHTSYGMTNSTGTIYRITNPYDNSTSGVSVFLDINALSGSAIAGANPHPNGTTDFSRDDASYGLVGKIAFGDMDISEDGMSLWAVNLNDRYLYKIPLGPDPYNPVAPTSWAAISRYPLFNICDCNNDGSNDLASDVDARPFAIKPYRGKIYVGLICSGASTPSNFNNLRARVFEFNPVTLTSTEVLNIPLTYNRGNGNTSAVPFPNGIPAGSGYTNANAANWRPWNDVYTTAATFAWSWYDAAYREGGYSQPIFAGLDFDDDGTMIIGLRDRFGDMIGDGVYDPGGTTLMEGDGNGDLLRAKLNGSGIGWTFSVVEATNGTEFFQYDNYGSLHEETSMGGLAIYHGGNHVINTVMDPVSNLSGGFDWTRLSDGGLDRSYEIVRRGSGTATISHIFAKANALGEIELLSLAAPIEIGNRVWRDLDNDGIQDANEPGISGVILELYDVTGMVLIASTTTDAQGYWYFNDSNVPSGLLVNTDYKVRISTTQFNNQGIGILTGLYMTYYAVAGTSAPSYADNDAQIVAGGYAEIPIHTEFSGSTNHNYDIGLGNIASLLSKNDISLKAVKKSNTALLKWSYQETGYTGFEIERSENGINFSSIGTLSKNTGTTFEFEDKNPASGVNYYRIRLLKIGTTTFSNNQALSFGTAIKTSIYPNPASTQITVGVANNQSGVITVTLFNQTGQLVLQKNATLQSGNTTIQLSGLEQFTNGVYILKTSNKNEVISQQKIVISH